MQRFWVGVASAGLLIASTVGAGMFALPYVVARSGWTIAIFYLCALGALLVFVHGEYAEVLALARERHRLTGLVRRYLGARVFPLASLAIIGGLLLTLSAYLILAGTFLHAVVPALPARIGLFLFWFLASLPLFLNVRRVAAAEAVGSAVKALMILGVLLIAGGRWPSVAAPAASAASLAFPFAPILFALAGWAGVGEMREYEDKACGIRRAWRAPIALGTAAIILLYLAFAAGIIASAPAVTPDTLSGLAGWPGWQVAFLGSLGIFAVLTAYGPVSIEVKDSLVRDFGWGVSRASLLVLAVPIGLVVLGLKDFLSAIGLAGGVFLSAQYVLIALVARAALRPSGAKKFLLAFTIAAFSVAAVYEAYTFVVG